MTNITVLKHSGAIVKPPVKIARTHLPSEANQYENIIIDLHLNSF